MTMESNNQNSSKRVRTKLDKEAFLKRQQAEGQEFLDEITQPDEEKAAKLIISKNKEAEKETLLDKFKKEEALKKKKEMRGHEAYIKLLATDAFEMGKHIDLPLGYSYWIGYDERRLSVTITSPNGKKFGRGINVCGNQVYDLHAVGVLLTQAENTIDKIEERGAFRKDGIILPK